MIFEYFCSVKSFYFFIKLLKMKDLKYLVAYILPFTTALGLYWQGGWAWATVLLIFGILPVLELWTPSSTQNIPPLEEDNRAKRWFFNILLYLNAPLLFILVGVYLMQVATGTLSMPETIGLTLGVGLVVGTCGINVAHELGHRQTRSEQLLSKMLLLPALYMHFFIEHNRGHHKHVATPLDPATAKKGETVYGFWLRSVLGSYQNAWMLETERLKKEGKSFWNATNEMLWFTFFQIGYLLAVALVLNTNALIGAVAIATVGFLLLETVNYLEHYGLQRKQLASGRYEPVQPEHSWNSNHELGRIFLYELTRHSDHHFKATRKYQVLRHLDESPQLPYGYPTSLLMSLVPPLWFYVMHRQLPQTK
jgi:alkane 1-monooxygenase